ncbi:MAG: hypothetical protein K6E73_10450 [Bacteroidales bacterium]|nr:hypothetical protein [Bacteroidales bacterium]
MKTKEPLMDMLHSEGMVMAGTKVQTTIITDMEIYGFVPLRESTDFLNETLNGILLDFTMKNTVIASDRLVISMSGKNEVHPILRYVCLQENNANPTLPLFRLYVPEYRNDSKYLYYRRSIINPPVDRVASLEKIQIVEKKDDEGNVLSQEAFYQLEDNELVFKDRRNESPKAVGKRFSVVCRRLIPTTGSMQMEIYNPEELFIVIDDND